VEAAGIEPNRLNGRERGLSEKTATLPTGTVVGHSARFRRFRPRSVLSGHSLGHNISPVPPGTDTLQKVSGLA